MEIVNVYVRRPRSTLLRQRANNESDKSMFIHTLYNLSGYISIIMTVSMHQMILLDVEISHFAGSHSEWSVLIDDNWEEPSIKI